MKHLILVFLGGGLGSVLRFGIGKYLNPTNPGFPWGTLAANLIGCFIIGLVFGWMLQKENIQNSTLLFLTAGFCGGFTTFSAFAHESLTMLRMNQHDLFFYYIAASIIIGLAFVWLGYQVIGLF